MDTHAPLKKLKKINLSLTQNPGLLLPFTNPFLLKRLTRKFGTAKDPQIKETYRKYKDYRNMFSTILKQSKTNCYNPYFETNWNSIKNIWKALKSISSIPKSLTVDGTTIFNPVASQIFSTTIFLQLPTKRSLIFHFHINIFLIFVKIDLIFSFL